MGERVSTHGTEELSAIFGALADPTRRALLGLLSDESLPVGELASHFEVSRPAISKHIRILREAGLIVQEKKGREHLCVLRVAALSGAQEWIRGYRSAAAPTSRAASTRPSRPQSPTPATKKRTRRPAKPEPDSSGDWKVW